LILVFAALVSVTLLAYFISLEEDELSDAFVGVDLGGKWGGVADFEGDLAAPLGLKGGDVDDEAATCVRTFAHADDQYVAGDLDVLNGFAECKGVGRDDDVIDSQRGGIDLDHQIIGERLGIDDGDLAGSRSWGKDLEARANADVIAITGYAIGDLASSLNSLFKGLNLDEAADLTITENTHRKPPFNNGPCVACVRQLNFGYVKPPGEATGFRSTYRAKHV